eukprot:1005416-Rhodomonas_salina.1
MHPLRHAEYWESTCPVLTLHDPMARYARPGTDVAYVEALFPTPLRALATACPVLTGRMVLPG